MVEDLGKPGWDEADAIALANMFKVDLSPTGGRATGGIVQRAIDANPAMRAEALRIQEAINRNRVQPPATYQPGGVVPITAEPLHEYEKRALTALGSGTISQRDPRTEEYLNRFGEAQQGATEMIGSSGRGFDQGEFDQYFNPYTEQVTQRTLDRLSDRAKEMRAQLQRQMASQRGNATLGDLYGAQRMGDIDRELIQTSGDILARGNEGAFNTALEALFRQRGLQSTAGQAMGGIAGRYLQGAGASTDILGAELAQGLSRIGAQQTAGENIRSYNQNLANMAFANQMAPLEAGNIAAGTALQQFPNIQGGSQVYYQPPINRFGQIATGISSAAQQLSNNLKF